MSQNYRQDSCHSYNPRSSQYQRQSNRSSYYNNSSINKQGQKYSSHYRERNYQDGDGYRNKEGRYYEGDKHRGGTYYRPSSSSGNYANHDKEEYSKYGQQSKDNYKNYKERQQRTYSRGAPSYRRYEGQYDKSYESKYEKRSRSRSKNRDQHYGQQARDYSKNIGSHETKGYHNQSFSGTYSKNERPSYSSYSLKNTNQEQLQRYESHVYKRDQREIVNNKDDNQSFKRPEFNKSHIYQKQQFKYEKDEKKHQQSKNLISIEVKSRQRSPSPKDKKTRKSHSSRSKSRSVSRRSKEKSRRKHSKKHRSSSSSSHSSSYSSSSSSSSSNRSSSSSSSRSSSSSYSQSVESRRYKHKQYRDSYYKISSQQKYPTQTQNYYNRERYDEKYQQKRPYEQHNSTYVNDKGADWRNYRQNSLKQSKAQKPNISQENLNEDFSKANQERKQSNDDKINKKCQVEIIQSEKLITSRVNKLQNSKNQTLTLEVKAYEGEPTQPINYQKPYQQRDSYRKYNPNSRLPNDSSYQQSYHNPRQFYNYNQYQNQQQQQQQQEPTQQSQVSDISPLQQNTELSVPSYPNRTYSADNQKMSFGGENDYQKRSFINQTQRRPYVNNYQNYPPRGNPPSMPYQSGFGNPSYQRFNQGFNGNRPFEKNFYQNRNLEGLQQNLPINNFSTFQNNFISQNGMTYQQNFPPQMRRVNSQMVSERKSSYFQQTSQNKDNDLNKTQMNKVQTEKEDLALIQQAFKRQSELKKINQLIPCSKTLQLIEKARQNLSIPAMKTNFLVLDLFKEMNDFKKQTMNSSLRSVLQQDFVNKYYEEKSKVFENLRLLNIDQNQTKQNSQKAIQKQVQQEIPTQVEPKQETQKMDAQKTQNQNPQQIGRPHQFIWKKPQMSQNLRQLKFNIQMLRKASSSLFELSRKIKVKELTN